MSPSTFYKRLAALALLGVAVLAVCSITVWPAWRSHQQTLTSIDELETRVDQVSLGKLGSLFFLFLNLFFSEIWQTETSALVPERVVLFLFLLMFVIFALLFLSNLVVKGLFGELRSKRVRFLYVTLDLRVFIVGEVVFDIEELLVHLDQRQKSCAGVLRDPQSRCSPLLIGKLFRNSDHVEVVTCVVDGH